ncbi:hypothetical protein ES705_22275 [subsurface metagenome]
MRRSDYQITDKQELLDILKQAEICRLALADRDEPYIVPINFGIEFTDPLNLYFHCAREGRKLDIIERNHKVCFEVEVDAKLHPGSKACGWSMRYRSVIGFPFFS